METMYPLWAVWRISSTNGLLCIEWKGSLEECVRLVEPRMLGAYAIMPYKPLTDIDEADPCDDCELADSEECYFCGRDPELI